MADYSAYAPARPPAQGTGYGSSSIGASAQGGGGGGYGSAGGLAGQMGGMSLQGGIGQSYGAYGHAPPPPTTGAYTSSSSSAYNPPSSSAAAGGSSASTSYGATNGYSAANRPRPQLSPVTSTSSSFTAAQGGPGGGSNYVGGTTNGMGGAPATATAAPRLPRKASLPSLPADAAGDSSSSSFATPAPPLPPLPSFPSAHSSYASSSLPPSTSTSTARDSTGHGGEAVFDGAALAASSSSAAASAVVSPPPRTASANANTAHQQQQQQQAKRANPLEDLIATEQQYVEDLGVVIKRVAAAWSRANFPPPELDSMFRAVEAVYRINKTLLAKLLAIGPSPSSPKALGDLLMRWIPDLELAYTRYATTYKLDYDHFLPVQSNPNLAPILAQLEYPASLPPLAPGEEKGVTLDRLFALPVYRVKYYQRLYAKLLRSTQEGRSDHALLVAANEKLERLERGMEEGRGRSVLGDVGGQGQGQGEEERREEGQGSEGKRREKPPRLDLDLSHVGGSGSGTGGVEARQQQQQQVEEVKERSSGESGRLVESPTSSSYRSSGATGASTANTSATNGVIGSGGSPLPGFTAAKAPERELSPVRVEDLEQRLNTERTLDIFSMQPRKCKLQMQPPNLPYIRLLRRSSPCTLSFVPSSDPSSRLVSHPRAYLILLTDLFLICERPSAREELPEGQDLVLLYPPLAGKHLQVEQGEREGEIVVTVMRKERLMFGFGVEGGREAREWVREIEETVRFGMSQTPARSGTSSSSTGARSPLSPTFNGLPRNAAIATPTGTTGSSSGHASPLNGSFPHQHQHILPNIQTSLPPSVTSPTPASPLSAGGLGYGNPSGLQPQDRRAFSNPSSAASASSSVTRPERKASMGVSPSPSSANFPSSASASGDGSSSSRGPSPYASSEYGQYQSPPPLQGRQSPYGQAAPGQPPYPPHLQQQQHDFGPPPPLRSPHQQAYPTYRMPPSHSQHDFAPPNAPFASGGYPRSQSRSSSRLSNGSGSSGGYGAPPPMPKELSYNGMDISGRGGPIYPTSMRTDPGAGPHSSYGPSSGYDSRSMTSGRSGLLSPGNSIHRSRSADGLRVDAHLAQNGPHNYRSPSQALLEDRAHSAPGTSRSGSKLSLSHSQSHSHGPGGGGMGHDDVSPPTSPVEAKAPEKTRIIAEMRCKVFLQQHHAQWKSLGTAKLKLFLSQPSMTKQLVVDSDKKGQTLVSTFLLTDGVERVGKTGVAIELSDKGDRTGIVYMLQMKTEQSATGLFEQFLLGTERMRR